MALQAFLPEVTLVWQGSTLVLLILILGWFLAVYQVLYNLYFHPLAKFPGPLAAGATSWWKTYLEVICQISMIDKLRELHGIYGDIVRIGPNELHFANPSAYNEIYNGSRRWDKDAALYRSFGQDTSSFGYLTYHESKERRDVLQRLFAKRHINEMQDLVFEKMNHLSSILAANHHANKSSDLFFGIRCFSLDTITSLCFARPVNALNTPNFRHPIIEAMVVSLPTFVVLKHFSRIRKAVMGLPHWLSIKMNPSAAGLIHLQQMLQKQVNEVCTNPKILDNSPHTTIYHALLNPGSYKGGKLPPPSALYDEAQAMVSGGTETVGTAITWGIFHVLERKDVLERLRAELLEAWPDLNAPPRLQGLEKLPYLTAVIKEILRTGPGIISPLLRVVPLSGATIGGEFIPGGAVVGMCASFVHNSETIFEKPLAFNPDRWLSNTQQLETWFVPFSKGPRSCFGVNLAWCELYIVFATLFRKFDMKLDGITRSDMAWRECFLPSFQGRPLRAFCQPREE